MLNEESLSRLFLHQRHQLRWGDNRIRVWHSTDQGYEDKEMKKKKREHIHDIGGEIFRLFFDEGQVFACSSDKTARQHDAEKRN